MSVADSAQQQFEEYFRLLTHWNSKINLTSLPVRNPTDEAFDRLLIEPLAAASHFPDLAKSWVDLGSGGGSPAIPIKILRPAVSLTMIEAKARKAAFLRETARILQLGDTTVENARFEALAPAAEFRHRFDVVTVRAVRADDSLFVAARLLLSSHGRQGRLLMFQSQEASGVSPAEFAVVDSFPLMKEPPSYLISLQPVAFHVEQSG
ncbi:MAG: 16S rRNA (guanine(527)-N(7))-methyltransferase RsmG [Vicinamibacterales bacterium]